ncbi:MAG: lytic murein transglycosylase, partial [Pseudorhodoplanes sp.]
MAAGVVLAVSSVSAQAQSGSPLNFLDNIFNPGQRQAQAPSAPAPAAGASAPLPWTGEDGASGHPLMTAATIREAAANFDSCVAGLWPDAARRGVSEQNYRDITAGLTPDLRLMDLMDSQPEFTKAIWDYLEILVNDNRAAKGREVLAQYKTIFDAAERAYGVDRYIVAS